MAEYFLFLVSIDFEGKKAYPSPFAGTICRVFSGAVMERREDVRYEVDLPLAFSGSEIAGGGMVISLSNEGCAVRSEEAVLTHTFLALRLQLPEPNAPLKVEVAEVRWTNMSCFGVEFVHLHAEELERLHRFIAWLKSTQNN